MRKIYFLGFLILAGLFMGFSENNLKQDMLGSFVEKHKMKPNPLGMALIPQGKNLIGMTDEDLSFYQGSPSRMTSFTAFYMDETETTNEQYRKFVNWVRDSIAITSMGPTGAPELYKPAIEGHTGPRHIDWKKASKKGVLWGKNNQYSQKLQNMYYSGMDALPGKNEIDVRRLRYAYSYVNLDLVAAGKNDPSKSRQDFIETYTDNPSPGKANEHPSVQVYPDTLVWKMDFSYSQNDPMIKSYFNHPAYNTYPVVGVTWEQANAFCNWLTVQDQEKAAAQGRPVYEYRLPTDQEFEYAARGGKTQTKYPWGGPYMANAKGCLQANFKTGRGNYTDDNGMYTVDVKSYDPNDFGLYCMAGNVAEWTSTPYNKSATSLLLDFNPNFVSTGKGEKVVRGGSWKDIAFFLQNSVSTYEKQDKARSYIGFRCVVDYAGPSS